MIIRCRYRLFVALHVAFDFEVVRKSTRWRHSTSNQYRFDVAAISFLIGTGGLNKDRSKLPIRLLRMVMSTELKVTKAILIRGIYYLRIQRGMLNWRRCPCS